MNQENPAANEGWPEDQADWPHAVGVVQGGVSPVASFVVNDLASAVQNVINKAEQKTGIRPDVVVTKPHHAAQPVVSAPEAAPQPATNDSREGKPSAVNAFKTSEDGRKFVAEYFTKFLLRQDFSSYINEHLAADFACALADGLHALQKHCDAFAAQAAFQRDARLGALKELAKVEGQRDMLLDVLKQIAKVDTPRGEMSTSCRLIRVKYLAQDALEKTKGGAV